MTRVLLTGSRAWTNVERIRQAFVEHRLGGRDVTVVHGGQVSVDAASGLRFGADHLGGRVAAERGCKVEVHKADWKQHGKAAGPIRNQVMVDLGADLVLAFPWEDATHSSVGTRDCMKRAKRAGIPVHVYPEGS